MDKYYDLIAYYLITWQKVAIDNTLYSVVLAMLAFLIGVQIVVLIKKSTIAELNQQLVKEKKVSELLEKRQEELLATKKHDAQLIADIQQEKEQLALNLQEAEVQYAEQIIEGEKLTQSLEEQKTETKNLIQSLNDKTQHLEKLEDEMDQQKDQLAQSVLNQTKMAEMENQASKFFDELNGLNQQLQQQEIDLNIKNNQIKQMEMAAQSAKKDFEQVVELESQIEKLKSDNATLQSLQGLEKSNAEGKAEHATELEKITKKHDRQIEKFNNQLQFLLKQPATIKLENKPSKQNEQETTGGIAKMFSFISSLDKRGTPVESSLSINSEIEKIEDPWQKHQQIIDQLIAQYSDQQIEHKSEIDYSQKNNAPINESYSEPLASALTEDASEATPAPSSTSADAGTKIHTNEAPPQEGAGSEKNVDLYADNNFGQYQEKFKKLFKKLKP